MIIVHTFAILVRPKFINFNLEIRLTRVTPQSWLTQHSVLNQCSKNFLAVLWYKQVFFRRHKYPSVGFREISQFFFSFVKPKQDAVYTKMFWPKYFSSACNADLLVINWEWRHRNTHFLIWQKITQDYMFQTSVILGLDSIPYCSLACDHVN